MGKKPAFLLLPFFFLALSGPAHTRARPITNLSTAVISDGTHDVRETALIQLNNKYLISPSDMCEQTYGFLPCTTSLLGNVFLIAVYGYLMLLAAKLLSNGSEILLQIIGPGIIGGLFLPVLSSVPDAAIILASGLSGSKETAQNQVSVGMGLLAGSTVMLLTVLWGSCLLVGKCDIEGTTAVDLKDTKRFSLTGSGVSTDVWTCYAARIMVLSIVPFIIVQLPKVLNTTSISRVTVLISLIVSISLVIAYSIYQVFQPWIQKRRIEYAKQKQLISGILKLVKTHSLGRLFTDDGEPNIDVIQKLFNIIDENADGCLSAKELRALVIGIQFEDIDMNIDDAIEKVMEDFDTSKDSCIDEHEFIVGISRWLNRLKHSAIQRHDDGSWTPRLINDFQERARTEYDLLGDKNDEVAELIENPKWRASKAVSMLLTGTIVAAVCSDPLVDAVDNFSTASNIPSLFVAFIILPFATSSEAVSALIFASRKRSRTSSLTYSAIYGSVTMSNILSLSVFLSLVYFRHLTWNFSAEVSVILLVCISMGLIASFRTTFPLWMCLVACMLYPISLLLLYVLDDVLNGS
ncbi:Sodium/calcium exchanger NCL1 [Citrus sinensis]|uniref:Sodium/calcium exchanger NCL1 n=1 Tax=Citrus sinensis TaxID=2711 RepID=A0ACB8N0D1_CITSI|nr:Sodium/calcium exchanger NCL1 [Citrus sinensis]